MISFATFARLSFLMVLTAVTAIGTSGCRDFSDTKILYAKKDFPKEVAPLCLEIERIGQVKELQGTIRHDMTEIKNLFLLHRSNLASASDRISTLSQDVQLASLRLTALASPELSRVNYKTNMVWLMNNQALDLSSNGGRMLWRVVNVAVDNSYDWAGDNDDLKSHITSEAGSNGTVIKFARETSALDICQLESSMVVYISVELEDKYGEKDVKHFILSGARGAD